MADNNTTNPLETRVRELVRAGFSGIWIETAEIDDSVAVLNDLAAGQNWDFDVWDIHTKLYSQRKDVPGPAQVLNEIKNLFTNPDKPGIIVLKNFHRFLGNPEVVQTLANCVVQGKRYSRHFVIVAPVVAMQPEIEKLFTVVHHELPDTAELREICNRLLTNPGIEKQAEEEIAAVVDAARGLTRLEAENAFALSLTKNKKLTPQVIWQLKAQTLEKSGTLSLYQGDANFENLGGLDNIKNFCMRALRKHNETTGKLSARGVLLLSPPGCGKSQFAKALGNEVGRPTITLDFGSLMGKFVGESEGNMRRALQQVDAMAPCVLFVDEIEKGLAGVGNSGQTDSGVSARLFGTLLTWLNDHTSDVFFIGTCNDASQLPAPFARAERFDGVFFVDLPADEQREKIWEIYLSQYELDKGQPRPHDAGWTGAEIKACCRLAALLDVPLSQAAKNVVPVSVTAAEQIDRLRKWAAGRCLSADNEGIYTLSGENQPAKYSPTSGRRKLATNGAGT
jgi:SpoVK/Ycf46/Vps4 family AAA+-type ATPase